MSAIKPYNLQQANCFYQGATICNPVIANDASGSFVVYYEYTSSGNTSYNVVVKRFDDVNSLLATWKYPAGSIALDQKLFPKPAITIDPTVGVKRCYITYHTSDNQGKKGSNRANLKVVITQLELVSKTVNEATTYSIVTKWTAENPGDTGTDPLKPNFNTDDHNNIFPSITADASGCYFAFIQDNADYTSGSGLKQPNYDLSGCTVKVHKLDTTGVQSVISGSITNLYFFAKPIIRMSGQTIFVSFADCEGGFDPYPTVDPKNHIAVYAYDLNLTLLGSTKIYSASVLGSQGQWSYNQAFQYSFSVNDDLVYVACSTGNGQRSPDIRVARVRYNSTNSTFRNLIYWNLNDITELYVPVDWNNYPEAHNNTPHVLAHESGCYLAYTNSGTIIGGTRFSDEGNITIVNFNYDLSVGWAYQDTYFYLGKYRPATYFPTLGIRSGPDETKNYLVATYVNAAFPPPSLGYVDIAIANFDRPAPAPLPATTTIAPGGTTNTTDTPTTELPATVPPQPTTAAPIVIPTIPFTKFATDRYGKQYSFIGESASGEFTVPEGYTGGAFAIGYGGSTVNIEGKIIGGAGSGSFHYVDLKSGKWNYDISDEGGYAVLSDPDLTNYEAFKGLCDASGDGGGGGNGGGGAAYTDIGVNGCVGGGGGALNGTLAGSSGGGAGGGSGGGGGGGGAVAWGNNSSVIDGQGASNGNGGAGGGYGGPGGGYGGSGGGGGIYGGLPNGFNGGRGFGGGGGSYGGGGGGFDPRLLYIYANGLQNSITDWSNDGLNAAFKGSDVSLIENFTNSVVVPPSAPVTGNNGAIFMYWYPELATTTQDPDATTTTTLPTTTLPPTTGPPTTAGTTQDPIVPSLGKSSLISANTMKIGDEASGYLITLLSSPSIITDSTGSFITYYEKSDIAGNVFNLVIKRYDLNNKNIASLYVPTGPSPGEVADPSIIPYPSIAADPVFPNNFYVTYHTTGTQAGVDNGTKNLKVVVSFFKYDAYSYQIFETWTVQNPLATDTTTKAVNILAEVIVVEPVLLTSFNTQYNNLYPKIAADENGCYVSFIYDDADYTFTSDFINPNYLGNNYRVRTVSLSKATGGVLATHDVPETFVVPFYAYPCIAVSNSKAYVSFASSSIPKDSNRITQDISGSTSIIMMTLDKITLLDETATYKTIQLANTMDLLDCKDWFYQTLTINRYNNPTYIFISATIWTDFGHEYNIYEGSDIAIIKIFNDDVTQQYLSYVQGLFDSSSVYYNVWPDVKANDNYLFLAFQTSGTIIDGDKPSTNLSNNIAVAVFDAISLGLVRSYQSAALYQGLVNPGGGAYGPVTEFPVVGITKSGCVLSYYAYVDYATGQNLDNVALAAVAYVNFTLPPKPEVLWVRQQPNFNTGENDLNPVIVAVPSGNGCYVAYQTVGTVSGGSNLGSTDIVVYRLYANGGLKWSVQQPAFNTAGSDAIPSIAADSEGCYVTYTSNGTASGQSNSGNVDIVVFRLNGEDGAFEWIQQQPTFNTAEDDNLPSIAADSEGCYVSYFTKGTASGQSHVGDNDIVLFRLNKLGAFQWLNQNDSFNTSEADVSCTIAADSEGCYVTYFTKGTVSGQSVHADGSDIVVYRCLKNGQFAWVNTQATGDVRIAKANVPKIAADSQGCYVAYQTFAGGAYINVFRLSKYNVPSWNVQQSIVVLANPSITADANGCYISYQTPVAVGDQTWSGGYDIVVYQLDTAGVTQWITQQKAFNTPEDDIQPIISVDNNGSCYVAYQTLGTISGQSRISSGNYDVVVFKLFGSAEPAPPGSNFANDLSGNKYFIIRGEKDTHVNGSFTIAAGYEATAFLVGSGGAGEYGGGGSGGFYYAQLSESTYTYDISGGALLGQFFAQQGGIGTESGGNGGNGGGGGSAGSGGGGGGIGGGWGGGDGGGYGGSGIGGVGGGGGGANYWNPMPINGYDATSTGAGAGGGAGGDSGGSGGGGGGGGYYGGNGAAANNAGGGGNGYGGGGGGADGVGGRGGGGGGGGFDPRVMYIYAHGSQENFSWSDSDLSGAFTGLDKNIKANFMDTNVVPANDGTGNPGAIFILLTPIVTSVTTTTEGPGTTTTQGPGTTTTEATTTTTKATTTTTTKATTTTTTKAPPPGPPTEPKLLFFKYESIYNYSTPANDWYPKIASDQEGNNYIAYYSEGTSSGQTNTGLSDIIILKTNKDGDFLWVRQQSTFNTTDEDTLPSICADSTGCYVAYMTDSTVSGGSSTGFSDIVVIRLNANGDLQWVAQSSEFNTTLPDANPSITADPNGKGCYVSYCTEGTVSGGSNEGSLDIIVFKLDQEGVFKWAKQEPTFNSPLSDSNPSIVADAGGCYVAYCSEPTAPGSGTKNVAVFRLTSDGDFEWLSNQVPNTSSDNIQPTIAADNAGCYVAYSTGGTASGQSNSGSNDIVVFRLLKNNGAFSWARQQPTFNTSNADIYPSIAANTTACFVSFNQKTASGKNVIVFKIDSKGEFKWVFDQKSRDSSSNDLIPSLSYGNNTCYITYSAVVSVLPKSMFTRNTTNTDIVLFGVIEVPVTHIPCFLEGTKILTIDGYKPIQSLQTGDLVKTFKQGFKPINVIGKATIYNDGTVDRARNKLYRYSKTLHKDLKEDLIITGNHSVLVDGFKEGEKEKALEVLGKVYVTEGKYRLPAYADTKSKPYELKGEFTIYHFALDHENVRFNYGVYANGLLVESSSIRMMKERNNLTLL